MFLIRLDDTDDIRHRRLGAWMPMYFYRMRGIELKEADLNFGIATLAAGILGTFFGGWLATGFKRVTGAHISAFPESHAPKRAVRSGRSVCPESNALLGIGVLANSSCFSTPAPRMQYS